MKATYIDLEGIDGSGKTTALKYVINRFREKGFKVLETREVGSPHIPLCVELRKLVLDPNSNMDGTAMELVFAAMRIESQKFYKTVETEYDFIISDRGWFSHLAYSDHNVSWEFVQDFYFGLIDGLTRKPDYVAFMDVNIETATARRNTRNNGAVDAIEAKGVAFQEKVLSSFQKYLSQSGLSIWITDSNGTLKETTDQLDQFVDDVISDVKPMTLSQAS